MSESAVGCLAAAGNRLGESPVWCSRRHRLYWVDSRGPALHWLDPAGRGAMATGSLGLPELVGSIGLGADHRLVAALERGLAWIDPDAGTVIPFAAPGDVPSGHRFNDGRVDPAGRFWAGTMNDGARTPTGSLYRFEADGRAARALEEIIVPNGLAWSPDAATMYFADSYRHRIWAFPFEPRSGTLGERRPFADLSAGPGRPDGSAVDAAGFLWNAEYAGARVVRYAPDGRVDRVIPMPVSNPTCCAFGGPDLATLFVTSAAQRLSPEQLAREPLAGGLFAIEAGVRGLPEPRFGIGREGGLSV